MTAAADATRVLVPVVSTDDSSDVHMAIGGWLATYAANTRNYYRQRITSWTHWLHTFGVHPFEVKRAHVELYGRGLTEKGLMDSTVAGHLSTIKSFYKWAFLEDYIDRDPTAHVRRPKIDDLVSRPYLDRMELGKFIAAAEGSSSRDYALVCLLAFNGLRISEALGANIETISQERGHHTLVIMGKGRKPATIPLVPRTHRALMAYIGERTEGPIFLGECGARMDCSAARRTIHRIARRAQINKRLSPHSLRRSFVTDALDAGVPLRDVQHSARHADPRTTARYDMNRKSLDSHCGYVVAAFVAGG